MMASLPASIALVSLLAALFWQTMRDNRDYTAFKTLSETDERLAFYRNWTLLSVLMMGVGGCAILLAMGRLDALVRFPVEFAPLRPDLPGTDTLDTNDSDMLLGLVIGAVVGLVALFFIWRYRIRAMRQPVVGDIEPLLPRNRAEIFAAAPLAISAGVCEEVFFRAALPLLAFAATGSAIAAFVIAGATFGLMHWYQGIKGVVVVTAVGAFFTWLYLSSGTLLKPMAIHTLMDLIALVVRPAISLRLNRDPAAQLSS